MLKNWSKINVEFREIIPANRGDFHVFACQVRDQTCFPVTHWRDARAHGTMSRKMPTYDYIMKFIRERTKFSKDPTLEAHEALGRFETWEEGEDGVPKKRMLRQAELFPLYLATLNTARLAGNNRTRAVARLAGRIAAGHLGAAAKAKACAAEKRTHEEPALTVKREYESLNVGDAADFENFVGALGSQRRGKGETPSGRFGDDEYPDEWLRNHEGRKAAHVPCEPGARGRAPGFYIGAVYHAHLQTAQDEIEVSRAVVATERRSADAAAIFQNFKDTGFCWDDFEQGRGRGTYRARHICAGQLCRPAVYDCFQSSTSEQGF